MTATTSPTELEDECVQVYMLPNARSSSISHAFCGGSISATKKGKDGKLIEPTQEIEKGFFSIPIPFECDIIVRSEKHAKVMRQEFEKAEKEGIFF
jgi:hypothetical protein